MLGSLRGVVRWGPCNTEQWSQDRHKQSTVLYYFPCTFSFSSNVLVYLAYKEYPLCECSSKREQGNVRRRKMKTECGCWYLYINIHHRAVKNMRYSKNEYNGSFYYTFVCVFVVLRVYYWLCVERSLRVEFQRS